MKTSIYTVFSFLKNEGIIGESDERPVQITQFKPKPTDPQPPGGKMSFILHKMKGLFKLQ